MTPPAFVDEAQITAQGGDGGDGIVSFLRERARPRGGPNGGDGGRGGGVYMRACASVNTLLRYRRRKLFGAPNGARGMGKDRHGGNGKDIVLLAPLGTRILDADTGGVHADLTADGQTVLLAAGGAGGWGNAKFKTAANRAPRTATPGRSGELRRFALELRLLADVGLLGLPNAGKSTFLRAISAAKPKVAAYPFTTLEPGLGLAVEEDSRAAVVADIPGLVEGAARGVGLGNRFLRHLSRVALLCQVADATSPTLEEDCRVIARELQSAPQTELAKKPRWLILNKMDLLSPDERRARQRLARAAFPFFVRVFALSARTGEGVPAARRALVDAAAK